VLPDAFQIVALNNSYGMSKSDNLKYTRVAMFFTLLRLLLKTNKVFTYATHNRY
jgi:hypothetical protein